MIFQIRPLIKIMSYLLYDLNRFMKRCRSATTQDEKASHYITILLSSVEYETFVKLMKIMRPVAEQRAKAETADAKETSGGGGGSNSKGETSGGGGDVSPAKQQQAGAAKEDEGDSAGHHGPAAAADAKSGEGGDNADAKSGSGSSAAAADDKGSK